MAWCLASRCARPVTAALVGTVGLAESRRSCHAETVSSRALLYYLRQVDTRTLYDASNRAARLMSTARPFSSGYRVVGRARPVRGDLPQVLAAIREAGPGDVVVVQGNQEESLQTCRSDYDILVSESVRRGVAGVVLDDHRPVLLSMLDFMASRGRQPAQISLECKHTQVEDIVLRGISVQPGDYILGDDNGVVVCSEAELQDWLARTGVMSRAKDNLEASQPEFQLWVADSGGMSQVPASMAKQFPSACRGLIT